jgi:hypothetical protein
MSEQLELFPQEELKPQEEINIPEAQTIVDAEWCFQFFDNEPIVFAWQDKGVEPSPLILQIQPKDGQGLNFQQSGMNFRIFPRQISEKTKLEREKQNASKDKEA